MSTGVLPHRPKRDKLNASTVSAYLNVEHVEPRGLVETTGRYQPETVASEPAMREGLTEAH